MSIDKNRLFGQGRNVVTNYLLTSLRTIMYFGFVTSVTLILITKRNLTVMHPGIFVQSAVMRTKLPLTT